MPRSARKKSKTDIYHVIVRGINQQDLFHEDEDYVKFLDNIFRAKQIDKFEIYGYCLMSNHVHLLLHEKKSGMETIMKRIGVSYVGWYNKKKKRVGHLFQDRYKSEPIEDEQYLLSVLRYIHNNPVKAGLVAEAKDYRWSSCSTYNTSNHAGNIVNPETVLGIFDEGEEIARQRWQEFEKLNTNDEILEIEDKRKKISDEELYKKVQGILRGKSLNELQVMDKASRDEIIRECKRIEGVTQRQIARVTGINQSVIFKA